MLDTDSLRVRNILGVLWVLFAGVNGILTFVLAGAETIPYHLIWASFAFLYGLYSWPRWLTWTVFWGITALTGFALVSHAASGIIGWTECSEIVLMGVILALLIWHVDRHRATQHKLRVLQEDERRRAHNREMASRFGTHEVRTRLTIARGFVELMAAGTEEPAVREDAAMVLAELDKATHMVTNLLTLVIVGQPAPRVPVDVDQLVNGVVHRWISTADRRWVVSSCAGTIDGDAERLEAALDCLIENAVKFTSIGDAIEIHAEVVGSELSLAVRDSGVGIPANELERVFEIFQTSSTAGERAGSGLGLPIVRAIVEARRGTLEVKSAVGVGTRFVISLPLESDRYSSTDAQQPAIVVVPSGTGGSQLVGR